VHETNWRTKIEGMMAGKASLPPYIANLKIPVPDKIEHGKITCQFEVSEDFKQPEGLLFGGYIAAVADDYLAMAAFSVLTNDYVVVTGDLRVQYFRPIIKGKVNIEAEVVNESQTTIHAEVTFKTENGKLAAKATATMSKKLKVDLGIA